MLTSKDMVPLLSSDQPTEARTLELPPFDVAQDVGGRATKRLCLCLSALASCRMWLRNVQWRQRKAGPVGLSTYVDFRVRAARATLERASTARARRSLARPAGP